MSETALVTDVVLAAVLVSTAVAVLLAPAVMRRLLARGEPRDTRWRDRPPRYWRIASPLLGPSARLLEPLLPARMRSALTRLLRHAGLDYALDAAQLVSGCAVAAALAGGLCVLALQALGAVSIGIGGPTAPAPDPVPSAGYAMLPTVAIIVAVAVGGWLPLSWTLDRRTVRRRAIARALPFYLDVITLSVESGANLTGALQHAAAKGPPGPLQVEIERVLRDVRAGRTRSDALRALADRLELPAVASWVAALIAAERHGSSLGPILRAQAEQRRQERFQHAEKLAMKAPVKMLAPLLVFFFPCTFVLLFFPVVVRLIEEGLLR